MQSSSVSVAHGILRNSAALLLVGVFSKAMGLVIAVLVARFLGPEATGIFALLFGIALLLENTTVLGLQDTLVREVAAHPERRIALFKAAVRLVAIASLLPSLGFLAASFFFHADQPSIRMSLLTLAVGTPCASVFVVSQAILQGAERMLWLTWTTFIARLVSMVWLFVVLLNGAGVEAAFQSRLMFHVGSAVAFLVVILNRSGQNDEPEDVRNLLKRSAPFAFNRTLYELTVRGPVLVLPMLLGLKLTGLFDAADRIRQTLAMTLAAGMTGIMPAFARGFASGTEGMGRLVAFSVKYTALVMSLVATALAVGSGWLIHLLYGERFAESALPLQLLVWAQVVIAIDAVLKQAMLAGRQEYAVVKRAVVGVIVQLLLVAVLGLGIGLSGVAIAVILAALIVLAADLRFVTREMMTIDVMQFVIRPLAAAAVVGAVLLAIDDRALLVRCAAAAFVWVVAAVVFRLLPADEARFLAGLLRHRGPKASGTGSSDGGGLQ